MGTFVTGATPLPTPKINDPLHPPTGNPAEFTAEDWNPVWGALGDLRSHTQGHVNVKSYGAVGDGVADDTGAIDLANAAALAAGAPLVFPSGVYRRTTPLPLHTGQRVFGANWRGNDEASYVNPGTTGPGVTTLRNTTGGHVIEITSNDVAGQYRHDIEIAYLSLDNEGMGGAGDGISIHNNVSADTGAWNLRLHDLSVRKVGGRGIYIDRLWSSTLQGITIDSAAGHALEIGVASNTVVLDHVYPHTIGTNKAGFRIHSGQVTMLGCNGVGANPNNIDWGVFGDFTGDVNPDGTTDTASSTVQATLLQCNIEGWTNRGLVAKSGSTLKPINCKWTAWVANTKGLVVTNAGAGTTIDDTNIFNLTGVGSWANGQPIHVNGTGPLAIGRPSGLWDPTLGNRAWDDVGASAFNLPTIEVGSGPSLRAFPLAIASQARNTSTARIFGWFTGNVAWTPGVVPAVAAGVPGSVSTTFAVAFAAIGDLALGSYDGAALPAGVECKATVPSSGNVRVTIYNFTATPTSSLPAGKAWGTIIKNDGAK